MAEWDEQRPGVNRPSSGNGSLAEEDTQAQVQRAIENARAELEGYVEAAADFIRERPVVCVAGAVAIGYLIGKIASRR
jgi:ElaB/YqjD/DUF883 family membrane-anchored ribosome-binding protein